jgi:hypothetical protein
LEANPKQTSNSQVGTILSNWKLTRQNSTMVIETAA